MNLTKQDLLEQREQIQEDLDCILDSFGLVSIDNGILTNACQMICDRFQILLNKLEVDNEVF